MNHTSSLDSHSQPGELKATKITSSKDLSLHDEEKTAELFGF
jgi:hypothetical protein